MSVRVGIIGARRANQGLGPFVARDLVALGAEVCGYTTTTTSSLAEASRQLAEYGVEANGYTRVDQLLAAEKLDAVAILSPADEHEAGLELALASGLHVLCEKPLLWGAASFARNAENADRLIDAFEARSLVLLENCQWPRALPSYFELFPAAVDKVPQHFAMSLCPASSGLQILGDALPHPLSILVELLPDPNPTVENFSLRVQNPQRDHLSLGFDYVAAAVRVQVELEFRRQHDPGPRPASFSIDGKRAERRIRPSDYRMELADGTRSVDLPDPLRAQLSLFLAELGSFRASAGRRDSQSLRARQRLLASICDLCRPELDD